MFKKLRGLIKEMEAAYVALNTENKLSTKLQKQNKDLLKTIDSYRKQGAVLLFEDLNEELIKKLQSFTEDNIIVIFCKDGTRIEIKSNEVNYKKENGAIR
jgi:ribosomal protein L7Ae-like RNA K-turn-binding protein